MGVRRMRLVGMRLLFVGLRRGGMLRVMRRPRLCGWALRGLGPRAGEAGASRGKSQGTDQPKQAELGETEAAADKTFLEPDRWHHLLCL